MAAWFTNPQTPLTVVRAWTCLGVNLLATPGLGSVMGGRRGVGRAQLYFSVAGFFLIVIWMFKLCFGIMASQINETPSVPIPAWWWQLGVGLFGIGWVWSLITSLSLVAEAKQTERDNPAPATRRPVPPRLDHPPGQPPAATRPVPPKLAPPPNAPTGLNQSANVKPLEASEIEAALPTVPEWEPIPGAIARTFQFEDFPTAIAFVDQIAKLAEAAGHHPDIDIRWNKVTLTLTTHDAGGLTEKDFALARQFDGLVG
jgi:4a-hydroxytetrahydrobiopterin dehydratase